VESYARLFHYYSEPPLLIVNAAEFDPVTNERAYESLLARICTMASGRHYFNPLPFYVLKGLDLKVKRGNS